MRKQAKGIGLAIVGARPRRPVPRRGGGAPSGGRVDRHRREESETRGELVAEDRRRLRHAGPSRAAQAAGSHRRHHRHRRAPARRSDHGGGRARRADADREAARHRSRRVRRACSRRSRTPSSTRSSATPSASGASGSAAKEKVRTGALGDVTLVTSRAFMNRLVAIDNYKRTDDPDDHLADGDLRHARARHRHVVPGGEDAGRMLRALDRQGARARSTRASTPPPA